MGAEEKSREPYLAIRFRKELEVLVMMALVERLDVVGVIRAIGNGFLL
jgi:hypothetical protein